MKSERLYAAIGAADDELINHCETAEKQNKTIRWHRWGALAACFCLVIIGAVIVNNIYHTGRDLPAEGMVISAYKTRGAKSACYEVPKCGTWFYFVDVTAALEEYADQEVTYLLAFDIFPDSEVPLTNESNEMKAELERLTGLGYEVGYIETRDHYYVAAGYFTAEQLESFPASQDYGYAFQFITKPVDVQNGLITDYSFGDGFDSLQ